MSNGETKERFNLKSLEEQPRIRNNVGPLVHEPTKNKTKGLLLFDNRRIRHLERMIDLFHTLFQNNK
ncbi:MAG: hypothetical protein ABUK01_15150 [Leptospirales bacterium]